MYQAKQFRLCRCLKHQSLREIAQTSRGSWEGPALAEQLSQDAVMVLIQQQYPELIPILNKSGVRDALFLAVENNYSPARVQAALQATEYYRTTSATRRAWDILTTVDPTTSQERLKQYQMKLESIINETGIHPTAEQYQNILNEAAANQWSDSMFKLNVVWQAGNLAGTHITGEMQNSLTQVDSLASDYGVPISTQTGIDWASKLTAGSVDVNAVRGYMIEQAKSLYPGLANAIDSGITVKQYTDPYAQIAARELNINPNDFNLQDTKWSAPLQQIDPKTGQRTAMSLDQWQTTLRTDPKYNYDSTQNAQSQAASLVTTLGQKFGAIG